MTFFVACSCHAVTAKTLDAAQAHAELLNANARANVTLCQELHIGVEAPTAGHAKAEAAKAARTQARC